eukprot:14908277-Alexandrium_andersonii.AAC.1
MSASDDEAGRGEPDGTGEAMGTLVVGWTGRWRLWDGLGPNLGGDLETSPRRFPGACGAPLGVAEATTSGVSAGTIAGAGSSSSKGGTSSSSAAPE